MAEPAVLAVAAGPVEHRLREVLDGEVARWTAVDDELGEPLEALRDLVLLGGKRLRPAFCHWGYVGAGGDPGSAAVVDAGAALELVHTMAVIHDDVMDNTRRRRGGETVHARFEARHRAEGWRGEPRRFGEGVAVLVGDLAFVYADRLLGGAPAAALEVFAELRVEVNVGQCLDVITAARGTLTPARARRICRYKSATYTVERPLHLGAALAGRLDELASPLSAYGLPVGQAFQLRDDLLDAFGDAGLTGKPVGGDLREGKPTVLRAIAAERADGDAARLLDRIGATDLADDEVRAIQQVLVDTGARAEIEREIDELVDEGLAALDRADLVPEARQALEELATFVAGRDH